jgi:hypothetical protein
LAIALLVTAGLASLPGPGIAPATAAQGQAAAGKSAPAHRSAPPLSSWAKDSLTKRRLVAYVRRVTKKGSGHYIPVKSRIAVFDQDGTIAVESDKEALIGEVAVALHRAQELIDSGSVKPGDPLFDNYQTLQQQFAADPRFKNTESDTLYAVMGDAFAGMSANSYVKYVSNWMATNDQPDLHIKWTNGFYRPMVQLMSYLEAHKFKVYVVSASQREYLWGSAGPVLRIPRSQMIGTDIELDVSDTFDVLRKATFESFNYDDSKIFNIYRQTGTKPVLAFGNSGGDYPMMSYTMSNRYPTMGFLVVHDDAQREYEYDADSRREAAQKNGWGAISMKDEFARMWNGTRTGQKPVRAGAKTR